MKDSLSRYTLRVEQALLDKLGYIAEYEGRTKNRELEQMIKSALRNLKRNTARSSRSDKKRPHPHGWGLFITDMLPLQVLFRLLAENVGHVATEDHVDLAAHGEVGGIAIGGDDDHHVVTVGGDVQMHGRTHQLADVHLALTPSAHSMIWSGRTPSTMSCSGTSLALSRACLSSASSTVMPSSVTA